MNQLSVIHNASSYITPSIASTLHYLSFLPFQSAMAELVPYQFFMLLPLATLLASVAMSQFVPSPPVNVTVSIKSEMGDATTLNVHCRAYWGGPPIPITDFGLHELGNEEIYSFFFQEDTAPELDRRVFLCDCEVNGYRPAHGQFYVHHAHLCKCTDGKCPLRIVKPEGFFCGDEHVGTWTDSV
jgi:hypothetical protein